MQVRVAEEHGKQKSAFFTSYVNMQAQYAQYNAQQGYMSDYNVKKEEEDHYGYGEGEEGGGTYNNWGNNQQNRFNPMGYGRPMGGGGGGRGRFRGRGGGGQRGRGMMRGNFRRGNFGGGEGVGYGGDYVGSVWENN